MLINTLLFLVLQTLDLLLLQQKLEIFFCLGYCSMLLVVAWLVNKRVKAYVPANEKGMH
jgi:hypothetical protein